MKKNRMVKRSNKEIEERKERILYALLERKQMTVSETAKLIKVNQNTIYRYLEHLKPLINHLKGGIIELNYLESKKYFEKELKRLEPYQKKISLIESYLEEFE